MKKKINVGIDYSLTSPCMCLMEEPSFGGSSFFFLTSEKRNTGMLLPNVRGDLHSDYLVEQERHDNISNYFLQLLKERAEKYSFHIILEDYSFGSKGRVFNLAENCGLLKHKLWENKYIFNTVAPTVLKKFATGKGNSNKDAMYASFLAADNPDINKIISPKKSTIGNPVSDIVDAYYLALYSYNNP